MKRPSFVRLGMLLVIALLLSVTSAGMLSAQANVPVTFGGAAVGNIPTAGATVVYNFNGNAGDLITVRVVGLTAGMDPNITLLGPVQEPLLVQDFDYMVPTNASAASVVFRLFTTGTYTVIVGGTPGDFVITIDAQPAIQPLILLLDEPQQLTVPFTTGAQLFAFNTDPGMPMTLHLDSEPLNLNATVEVRDGTGQLTALFQGDVDNACVSVAPGDELFTLSVNADPDAAGTITLTLSNGPCALGPAPEPAAIVIPPPQFVPVEIPGVCAASSINNVNIRTGPGREYPVIALWMNRTPIQVVGRSEDGIWWAVQTPFFSGWMSSRVVSVVGPCDNLPVIPASGPAPAQTATPGLPMMTPTPLATMTGTVAPTAGATGTAMPTATGVQPTATPPATALPTIQPTNEITPEATSTVG